MRNRFNISLIILACAFTTTTALAQTSRMSGSVIDASGAVVPNATVDVLMPGGAKPILSTTTTGDGLYSFTAVPPGTYDLTITATGFTKFAERNITLAASAETSVAPIRPGNRWHG